MNVQGRNLGGCMEYGRSVLLRRDPGLGTGTFSLIVFQRIGIVRMIPLFTPPGRAARSPVPMQITFEIRKLERQCQSKSLILPGGRLESV
jgi:hypothetical protein